MGSAASVRMVSFRTFAATRAKVGMRDIYLFDQLRLLLTETSDLGLSMLPLAQLVVGQGC